MTTNPVVEKILDDIRSKNNTSGTLKLEGVEEPKLRTIPTQETKPQPEHHIRILNKPESHHSGHHASDHHKSKPGYQFEEAAKSAKDEKLAKEKSSKSSFLDEPVTIKFNPRRFVKWTVIVLLFISIFYIGRLTVGETDSVETADTPIALATEESATEAASTAEEPAEEESFISGISGFFTKIIPDFSDDSESDSSELSAPAEPADTETVNTTAAETTITTATETNASTTSTPTAAAVAEPAAEPVEEPIITTYSKVSLSLSGINIEWKETYGKMTKISYKIVNKEAGTVQPSYFIMLVEGYDTGEDKIEKRIDLPKNSQSIKSMKAVSSVATIENGFSYSVLETGDLASVQITLQLYDAAGVLITTVNKNMDLSG